MDGLNFLLYVVGRIVRSLLRCVYWLKIDDNWLLRITHNDPL